MSGSERFSDIGPGVLGHVLFDRDVGPLLRVFAVELEPLLEARLGVRLDSVDRALRYAYSAIDALVGVDDEHVLVHKRIDFSFGHQVR